jgi:hypothetical protein
VLDEFIAERKTKIADYEKGEVHCRAGTVSAYVGREPTRTWIKNGFVRAVTRSGTKRYSPNLSPGQQL